jgi:glycosyltransferase involved in cell wall biosynthesis
MYLGLDEPIPFRPPWAVPFESRRAWLEGGDLRVAYVYELEDTSTFRYRVFNMVEALRARPELRVSATWFTRAEFHTDQSFVDHADLVVLCRTRYDDAVARLAERARARGVKVVFDVDDLVFDPSYIHYIMNALGQPNTEDRWDYWFSYIGRLKATLDLCDAGIATNTTLGGHLERVGGVPTGVLPNFLNRVQTEVSDRFVGMKRAHSYRRDRTITCAFLSGSPSHGRDLSTASAALASALRRHPGLRLLMVGFVDLDHHLKPFRDRMDSLALLDYLNLQRVTASAEFCIVPLNINSFSVCKSELKFFESGIVECPIVASPIPSYVSAITDGRDGWLAGPHEWTDRIESVLELIQSGGDGFARVAEAAGATSRARYAWDEQAPAIARTLRTLVEGRSAAAVTTST